MMELPRTARRRHLRCARLGVLLLAALLVVGLSCTRRVSLLSPRLEPTQDNRAAKTNADCADCHDLGGLRDHAASDDCLRCHRLLPGG
jgi:uncharacterized paraquat-inducible protein A